jgi:6-phosphogluconate dehydrogenase
MVKCDIGLIGLAVMGQNLALNMERHGYRVAVYNRTTAKTEEFMAGPAAGKHIQPAERLADFFASLQRPRQIIIMVQAGAPVDAVIAQLRPFLQPGDLVIDGGNSFYRDTERRSEALTREGLHFLGVGISGGEEGALWGPSIMPGGPAEAYALVEPVFQAIAARVDDEPCVTYIGPRGAGHYVKMVHNGIEYGDMQLIAEAYDLLQRGLGLAAPELALIFARWNQGVLSSFLIEITAQVLSYTDPETGKPLVDLILDTARQKGTGKWTSQDAFDLGVPVPTINAAVEGRILSAYKAERLQAASFFPEPAGRYRGEPGAFIDQVESGLYASKILSYAQGMALLAAASREYGYNLNLSEIARIWRGGCIIRARFLNDVRAAFAADSQLPNLVLAPFFRNALLERQAAWRAVLQTAIELGIPALAFSASLATFDSYRSARLPANLIQAQRDLFGAHTYERLDRPGTFHTVWND